MDKDIKITLSLFLTWLVFGLFNLFGQPQAFVPPIIIDGLMVVGLGVYFCFPFRKNFFYPGIIFFTLLILLLSLIELNWLSLNMTTKKIAMFLCFTLSFVLLVGSIIYYRLNKIYGILAWILSLSFTFSFFFGILTHLKFGLNPIYIYILGGIISAIILLFNRDQHPTSKTFNRMVLILFLNFLFDIGNYLALLALA